LAEQKMIREIIDDNARSGFGFGRWSGVIVFAGGVWLRGLDLDFVTFSTLRG
jgi:hypothetical protein